MLVNLRTLALLMVPLMFCLGCGRPVQKFPADTRVKSEVTGSVKLKDSQSKWVIRVSFVPEKDIAPDTWEDAYYFEFSSFAEESGKFSCKVATGKYAVIFRKFGAESAKEQAEKEQFNKKYGNSDSSKHKITVEEGKPLDIGVVDLTK